MIPVWRNVPLSIGPIRLAHELDLLALVRDLSGFCARVRHVTIGLDPGGRVRLKAGVL